MVAFAEEVRVIMLRQQGQLVKDSIHVMPVGQAYEMIRGGASKIHPDDAKAYEPFQKAAGEAQARADKAAAERGAKNAADAKEAAAIANDQRTIDRLRTGSPAYIQRSKESIEAERKFKQQRAEKAAKGSKK